MRNAFERFEVPTAVAVGGALGSLARYGINQVLPSAPFPSATFVTNLFGCFALGVVLVAGEVVGHRHHHAPTWVRLWRPFMATGVLGGFTTFSTYVLEIIEVPPVTAALYAVSSVVLGIVAYIAGNRVARQLLGVNA